MRMGGGRGEESSGEEGEDGGMRKYRQRINVLNDDIQSFIMDAGEDGDTVSKPLLFDLNTMSKSSSLAQPMNH